MTHNIGDSGARSIAGALGTYAAPPPDGGPTATFSVDSLIAYFSTLVQGLEQQMSIDVGMQDAQTKTMKELDDAKSYFAPYKDSPSNPTTVEIDGVGKPKVSENPDYAKDRAAADALAKANPNDQGAQELAAAYDSGKVVTPEMKQKALDGIDATENQANSDAQKRMLELQNLAAQYQQTNQLASNLINAIDQACAAIVQNTGKGG